MTITRRGFNTAASGAALMPQVAAAAPANVRFGIDLFSVRSSGWTAFQHLDYCARWKAKVVHFSEIRFMGNLEPDHLKKVRAHAGMLGIEIELGMRSICPTSKAFDPAQGTAEQQLTKMIESAKLVGSPIVRCFLGSMADRGNGKPGSPTIEQNMENTVKVLKAVRSRALDAGIKIAVENHAGDMQGRELRALIEAAGPDFVGAVIDSGNPLWAIEDPHVTLDALAPYVLTSHIRDSVVWRVPDGAAMRWVRMGEGNVDIDGFIRKFAEKCPGKALSMEIIVIPPRVFAFHKPEFWEGYRNVPAWNFSRFVAIADSGVASAAPPKPADPAAQERTDLEASIHYTHKLLGIA
ncbi:MAG: sugar phosphate isomerase/epimerase [Bryobacterales bacterium]|nr:sugar phosphate isomerase/epimerase [Bryobacterales bacterium]